MKWVSGSARSAPDKKVSAALRCARKFRGRGSREPSEEATGQARAIVDHDALADHAGLIENHSKFLTQGLLTRQSID